MSRRISRRELLRYVGLGGSAALLAACQPKVVEKIVKETVLQEKVVKEVVKETVMVAGTPKVVEREVTRVVAATPAPEEREIVDIVVGFAEEAGQVIIQDAPAHLAVMSATGTRINYQTVGEEDWDAKRKMLLATGQVPDIMEVDNAASIQDYASP
ncbi:MAG TPA: hypothetical protein VMY98_05550, partial [Anaerolineae bacterium]|nr:hypothetical protein [Anaerolineae bacterium]